MALDDYFNTPDKGDELCVRLEQEDETLRTQKGYGSFNKKIKVTSGIKCLDTIPPNHHVKIRITSGGSNPRGRIISPSCDYQNTESREFKTSYDERKEEVNKRIPDHL